MTIGGPVIQEGNYGINIPHEWPTIRYSTYIQVYSYITGTGNLTEPVPETASNPLFYEPEPEHVPTI